MSAKTIILYKASNGYFYQDDDRCLFAQFGGMLDSWESLMARILSQILGIDTLNNEDSITISDLTSESTPAAGEYLVIPKGSGYLLFSATTSFVAESRTSLVEALKSFTGVSIDIMEQNTEYTFSFPVAPPPEEE